MIRVSALTLQAGSRTLLREASFELVTGEFVAVLGPNGAGKSTLLRAISGIRAPESGRIEIMDSDVARMSAAQRARMLAQVVSDDVFADRLRVREVVAMGRYPHHRWWQWSEEAADARAIEAALEAVNMHGFGMRSFDTLSSGERARIWIALALAQESSILLLDEPTSHLDVRVAQEILALLRRQTAQGRTVVCALHDLNEAAGYADRALLLDGTGAFALNTVSNLFENGALERTYCVKMERVATASGLRLFPAHHEVSASRTPVP
jgi:iron complex transport system ATP-binding protein